MTCMEYSRSTLARRSGAGSETAQRRFERRLNRFFRSWGAVDWNFPAFTVGVLTLSYALFAIGSTEDLPHLPHPQRKFIGVLAPFSPVRS